MSAAQQKFQRHGVPYIKFMMSVLKESWKKSQISLYLERMHPIAIQMESISILYIGTM